ncbi:uncharacterized protein LOC110455070 isoform X1 [Mizuhopecten yessoensis]|uniref:uncharacterized protein LOC110455070 isoform X1 n=2 Tax=Mizuhopecten yessoensis TaxID=6573 RepID=UPI000B458A0C|nr:uncharacterized protein LOC110455070 isoform X1 [Mizuhopecten yessoensis]
MGNTVSHQVFEPDADLDEFDVLPPEPPTELELQARQILPAEYDYPFENIVFEGGGSKGMAYCGAVRVLENIGLFPQIKRFAGTSAGAITAALLSAGYNSHDIETFMKNDLSKNFMLDGSFLWRWFTCLPRFILGYGLSPATQINEWLGDKLRNKTGSADVTFEQLYDRTGKELCVVVTNVNNMSEEYCHPKTTPDMPVRLAVLMSMSIPGMFQVVKYNHNARASSNMYIDGGILCNFPIHCFDGWWLSMKPNDAFIRRLYNLKELPIVMSKAHRFGERSDKTLGFLVYSEAEADNFKFYLEKRSPVLARSNSSLNRRRKTQFLEQARERKRIADAVNRFLPLVDEYDKNHDGKVNYQEFQQVYDHFPDEDKHILFGDHAGSKALFETLDENSDGQVRFQEIMRYVERKGLDVNQKYLGYKRQDVTSLTSYALTVFDTMLLNLKRLYMEHDDLERSVGINTGHIETADFDLEDEDIAFMLEQGKNTTVDFLKMYAAKRNAKLAESSGERN